MLSSLMGDTNLSLLLIYRRCNMKNILGVYTAPRAHWVGDGFPVRTLFSYDSMGEHVSPFLLLDYMGLRNSRYRASWCRHPIVGLRR